MSDNKQEASSQASNGGHDAINMRLASLLAQQAGGLVHPGGGNSRHKRGAGQPPAVMPYPHRPP
jgi:hypothetical protein